MQYEQQPDAAPDAALPYLQYCADPHNIRRLANAVWGLHIQSNLALTRTRYRRGQRCIMQFIPEKASQSTETICALVYPATHIKETWRKIQRRLGEHPDFGKHVTIVEELGLLLLRYPFDHQLPQLLRYANGLSQEDGATIASALGLDAGEIMAHQIECLRYRYGLCAVLRVKLHDRAGATHQAIVKCYADAQAQDTIHALGLWNSLAERSRCTLSTVEPLADMDSGNTLLLSHAQGQPLEALLVSGADGQLFQRLGQELAALHHSDLSLPKQYTQEMEASNLRRATTYLVEALPNRAVELTALVEHIIAAQQWPARLAPTHRDLKLDHIFVRNDQLTLIDLDSCAMTNPLLDPALLLARLAAAPHMLGVSEEACASAARQLIDAYGHYAGIYAHQQAETIYKQLEPFVAGAMLDVASGFCRRHEANWREAAEALIARTYGPVSSVIST